MIYTSGLLLICRSQQFDRIGTDRDDGCFAALRRFCHAEDQAFRDPLSSVGGVHPGGDDAPAVRAFPVQADTLSGKIK